jgi:hypothetical protein
VAEELSSVEPESAEKASPQNPYKLGKDPKPLAEVVALDDVAVELMEDAEQGAKEDAEPATESSGAIGRTYAWVAAELSSATTELSKMKLLENYEKCAELKVEMERLTAELALLPKPRTHEVVKMELEKKDAEIMAMAREESRGWNAGLRTITKPVTESLYCSQMLWNVIVERLVYFPNALERYNLLLRY